jgi:hypothetical protein
MAIVMRLVRRLVAGEEVCPCERSGVEICKDMDDASMWSLKKM